MILMTTVIYVHKKNKRRVILSWIGPDTVRVSTPGSGEQVPMPRLEFVKQYEVAK